MNVLKVFPLVALIQNVFTSLVNQYDYNSPFLRVPNSLSKLKTNNFSYPDSGAYSNLYISDGILYATGLHYVFRLSLFNISDRSPSKGYFERRFDLNNTHDNEIRYLTVRKHCGDVVICTTNHDHPQLLHLKQFDLSFRIEYNGAFLCPATVKHKSLALIVYEDTDLKYEPKGLMYSAIWTSKLPSLKYGNYSRYGIFRKDTENDENFVRTLYSQFWLWEPEFIDVFEDSLHVYFFITELAIESTHAERYTRIVRVCKNDRGSGVDYAQKYMWTTFRKIRFNCAYRKNNSVFLFNNLVFIHQIDSDTLIGIFEEYLFDEVKSIFCEIKFDQLAKQFSVKKFKDSDLWLDQLNCSHSANNEDNYESIYEFLSTHTLLDAKLSATVDFILPLKILSVAIEKILNSNETILHLITVNNEMIRILRYFDMEFQVHYKILLKLSFSQIEINEILIEANLKFMYLASENEIIQVNLKQLCSHYQYCLICSNDPYCEWSVESKSCKMRKDMFKKKNGQCLKDEHQALQLRRASQNETLILNCGFKAARRDEHVWTLNRIKWFFNNTIALNTIDQNGNLILLPGNTSDGFYTCTIVDSTNRQFIILKNISISTVIVNQVSEMATTETTCNCDDSLLDSFNQWKQEYDKYMDEVKQFFARKDQLHC